MSEVDWRSSLALFVGSFSKGHFHGIIEIFAASAPSLCVEAECV
jgi:hypothetical protein